MGITGSRASIGYSEREYYPSDTLRLCTPDRCLCPGGQHRYAHQHSYYHMERGRDGTEHLHNVYEYLDQLVMAGGNGGFPDSWKDPRDWTSRDYERLGDVLGGYWAWARARQMASPFLGPFGPGPWGMGGMMGTPPWSWGGGGMSYPHGDGGEGRGGRRRHRRFCHDYESVEDFMRDWQQRSREEQQFRDQINSTLFGSEEERRREAFSAAFLNMLREAQKKEMLQQQQPMMAGLGLNSLGANPMMAMSGMGMAMPGGGGGMPGGGMPGMVPGLGGMGMPNPMGMNGMNPMAMQMPGGVGMPNLGNDMMQGVGPMAGMGMLGMGNDLGGGLMNRRRLRNPRRLGYQEDDDDDFGGAPFRRRGGGGKRLGWDDDDLFGDGPHYSGKGPRPRGPQGPRPTAGRPRGGGGRGGGGSGGGGGVTFDQDRDFFSSRAQQPFHAGQHPSTDRTQPEPATVPMQSVPMTTRPNSRPVSPRPSTRDNSPPQRNPGMHSRTPAGRAIPFPPAGAIPVPGTIPVDPSTTMGPRISPADAAFRQWYTASGGVPHLAEHIWQAAEPRVPDVRRNVNDGEGPRLATSREQEELRVEGEAGAQPGPRDVR